MALDLARYRASTRKKITESYSVPVDEETRERLRRLKAEHGARVSAWVRDLILDNLPEFEEELKRSSG